MSTQPPSCFLALPTELRFQVYHIVGDMILQDAPTSAFKGLYLFCHHAKAEMDAECVAQIRRTIANVWNPARSALVLELEPSKTFSKIGAVNITVPASAVSLGLASDISINQLTTWPLDAITVSLKHQDDHDDTALARVNKDFFSYIWRLNIHDESIQHTIRVGKMIFADPIFLTDDYFANLRLDYIQELLEPAFECGSVWRNSHEIDQYATLSICLRVTTARAADVERWFQDWHEHGIINWA